MKLVLGTAQLGEDYGIAFPGKKITKSAFTTILNIAKNNNIFNIDTAVAYGDSLTILGEISVDEMLVISKLPKMPEDFAKKDINSWLNTTFEKMLRDLRLKNIHTLLIHNSADLTGKFSSELINFLHKIKLNNLVKKVGVSIYEPEEIGTFYNFFKPDVIQCPYNIFDQRILRSGWLDKLVANKVEVHARSIFLQGVLLKNFLELDSYFSKWEDKFIKFENYCYQQQTKHGQRRQFLAKPFEFLPVPPHRQFHEDLLYQLYAVAYHLYVYAHVIRHEWCQLFQLRWPLLALLMH